MTTTGGVGLCATMFTMMGLAAWGQDVPSDTKDAELKALKERVEALEKKSQEPKEAQHGADPVEEKWYDRVKVGGGIRAKLVFREDQSPSAQSYSQEAELESGRIYTGGKITDVISATLNAEFTGDFSVLDAIAQFTFSESFNIYMGRHLPACDRSDSDGPYYLIAWDYPELSVNYTNMQNGFGRDDGFTVWGDLGNFKYWAGVYEGGEPIDGSDRFLYAARLQYNFWDAEKGFYLSSTYHGSKNILAFAIAFNWQENAAGLTGDLQDEFNLVIDGLFEKKLDFGVITAEAAYYIFDRGGYAANGLAPGVADIGEGTGFMATLAVLIHGKVGIGEFQPLIRIQNFTEGDVDAVTNLAENNFLRTDIGFNYVMSGHNARIAVIYSVTGREDGATTDSIHHFTIGTQVQF